MIGKSEKGISIGPQRLYYLQSFGSEGHVFDKSYSQGMFRNPQSSNLDKHETEQANLDYKETSNLTNASSAEVISDYEFILEEDERKGEVQIKGLCEIGLQLRIRADGTRHTYLDKAVANLSARNLQGDDRKIFENIEYEWGSPVDHSADSWDDKVGMKIHEAIEDFFLKKEESLVLQLGVWAHVTNENATDNKVRIYHSRGSAESYIFIPMNGI